MNLDAKHWPQAADRSGDGVEIFEAMCKQTYIYIYIYLLASKPRSTTARDVRWCLFMHVYITFTQRPIMLGHHRRKGFSRPQKIVSNPTHTLGLLPNVSMFSLRPQGLLRAEPGQDAA